jgi:hypothetical protein
MVLSATTQHRLAGLQLELEREFPNVPPQRVRAQLEKVTGRLVSDARFDEYIPLLAYRQARERLVLLEVSPQATADENWLLAESELRAAQQRERDADAETAERAASLMARMEMAVFGHS